MKPEDKSGVEDTRLDRDIGQERWRIIEWAVDNLARVS